jgi:chromosome segregation ATPase
MNEAVRNLEKHSIEYNNELTEAKDELIKLRGERDKYEQRLNFMWERLDF